MAPALEQPAFDFYGHVAAQEGEIKPPFPRLSKLVFTFQVVNVGLDLWRLFKPKLKRIFQVAHK